MELHYRAAQSRTPNGKVILRQYLTRFRTSRISPRVQDFVSYGRLVQCAKESGDKRLGPLGKKIGNVQLRWVSAEAAVLFLRRNQPGKEYFAKLERKHGTGKALIVLAHKLARVVYYMRSREQAFDLKRFVTA